MLPVHCEEVAEAQLERPQSGQPEGSVAAALARLSCEIPYEGDRPDLGRIYSLYCRRVYTLCLRMVGEPAEAADLAQEAFIRVFNKLHTFRGESAFSTWLHRVVVNVVLRSFRRKSQAQRAGKVESLTDEQSDNPAPDVGAPDMSLVSAIDRVQLQRAIALLPPRYRLVFIMHDVQGFAHHEIGVTAGISVGTSKSHLHKARRLLRRLLSGTRRNRRSAPAMTPLRSRVVSRHVVQTDLMWSLP